MNDRGPHCLLNAVFRDKLVVYGAVEAAFVVNAKLGSFRQRHYLILGGALCRVSAVAVAAEPINIGVFLLLKKECPLIALLHGRKSAERYQLSVNYSISNADLDLIARVYVALKDAGDL